MRRWFERLPIHRKLVASALLITAVALAVQMIGISAFDLWRYRTTAARDAQSLAGVLSENIAAAVMFGQEDAAAEILLSVRVRAEVTRACAYLPDGRLFAGEADTSCPPAMPRPDDWNVVSGMAPIVRNGRTHGVVYVERTLADLRRRLLLTGVAGLAMFGVAALAAYLMASRVNTAISRPIAELALFVRRFGDTPEAPLPPIRVAPDELGALVTAFVEMVGRVRTASAELVRSNDALRHETAERNAALERTLEVEHRFKMLADGSPVLLWVNGPDGCEFVNRAYVEFLGARSDLEMQGFDWTRFVHPDDRESYVGTYVDAFSRRASFTAEFRFLRHDGEWRWMRSEATPRIERGEFAGYVGASVDITERKRAEEALREADQRKDAFLAVLAHELRNPLAPIRTGLELLRMGGARPDAVPRVLPVLERQVAHMVRLIDDLLDVSRITSGKIHLQRQPTPLEELVNAAVDANREAVASAGLSVTVALPDVPCLLDVDPTRFVQVLSNLLHNATKFTDRGGQIGITASIDAATSAPILQLVVSDSGEGIDASVLPHVFDFFVQGDTARRAKSGLGIGLGLARQLVEMHGGTIDAASPGHGAGSAFTIRMPVEIGVAQAPAANASGPEGPSTVDRRVLIIDDNVDAADTLAALVAALGGEARTAHDGPDGLREAAEFGPDVILLDIGMPGMDGYETCRRLRTLPVAATVYIVALTGWGQLHDRERAVAEGFDAHVTKPADPRVLAELLARAPARRVRSEAG